LDNYCRKIKILGSADSRALQADKVTREELLQEQLGSDTVTDIGQVQ